MAAITVSASIRRPEIRPEFRSAVRPEVRPGPMVQGGRSRLRLTARGRRLARVTVVALALAVTLTLMVFGHGGSSQADVGPAVTATSTVVVQPGQTLWGIAREVAPDVDVRETVERIQVLSGLTGASANVVHPGQRLVVPRSS